MSSNKTTDIVHTFQDFIQFIFGVLCKTLRSFLPISLHHIAASIVQITLIIIRATVIIQYTLRITRIVLDHANLKRTIVSNLQYPEGCPTR